MVQLLPLCLMDTRKGRPFKENTHQRRGRNMHTVVSFTADAEFSGKKEEFVSRDANKQRLIRTISDQLASSQHTPK